MAFLVLDYNFSEAEYCAQFKESVLSWIKLNRVFYICEIALKLGGF